MTKNSINCEINEKKEGSKEEEKKEGNSKKEKNEGSKKAEI